MRARKDEKDAGGMRNGAASAVMLALALGLALGALAIAADAGSGPLFRILLVIASTGLAWGAGAFLMGLRAPTPSVAAIVGPIVMLAAVSTYYGGAVLIGLRPGGAPLIRALAIWAVLGLLGGVALGLLGWYGVNTTGRTRSIVWGVVAGLLASQGVYLLSRTTGGFTDPEAAPVRLIVITSLAVGSAVLLIGSQRRHLLPGFAAMVVLAALGAFAWSVLQGV